MELTELARTRLNGYVYVLERTLRTALPPAAAREATREIEAHLLERVAATPPFPDELTALDAVLRRAGSPLAVAQAFVAERLVRQAASQPRLRPVMHALIHLATTSMRGFVAALLVAGGYVLATAGVTLSAMKLLYPERTGFWFGNGADAPPIRLAMLATPPAGQSPAGGYWVVLIGLVIAALFFTLASRGARALVRWLARAGQTERAIWSAASGSSR